MYAVPEQLTTGPISRSDALAARVPARVLEGVQFSRIHESVYCHRTHEMSFLDRIAAARLALPVEARTTGITRIQELGLSFGASEPLHFVVPGDLHLVVSGVFLHRTVSMPSADEAGVDAEPAFVAFCAEARVVDAIKVGSMLRRLGLLDLALVKQLLVEQPWRRGVRETRWVIEHLDGRCRSMPEAELLSLVRFSGLPEPEVNPRLRDENGMVVMPDLWWASWRRAVEYEGSHHQQDRDQYIADIDRYRIFRTMGVAYLQITKERLRRPRRAITQIHPALVEGGYDGSAPVFGHQWAALFQPLRDVVRRSGSAALDRE